MHELLQHLLRRIPTVGDNEAEKICADLLQASKEGPESIQAFFERVGKSLANKAEEVEKLLRKQIGE